MRKYDHAFMVAWFREEKKINTGGQKKDKILIGKYSHKPIMEQHLSIKLIVREFDPAPRPAAVWSLTIIPANRTQHPHSNT